ncbi:hypothetical protein, partial [Vibrio parahaemolyticus]|uniref:hypothetical protein n=1 Tax=Vibrio parahaemolyticus TaxID=670 RepID=UPI001A8FE87D
ILSKPTAAEKKPEPAKKKSTFFDEDEDLAILGISKKVETKPSTPAKTPEKPKSSLFDIDDDLDFESFKPTSKPAAKPAAEEPP